MPYLNKDSMSSEQGSFCAQKIIDHFYSEIRSSNCLTPIPITLYQEADEHKTNLETISGIFDRIENPNVDTKPTNPDSASTPFANDPISLAIKKAIGKDCLDCKPKLPTINLAGMRGDFLNDAKQFLENIKSLKGAVFNSQLPSFAFLFSSFCIPDLIKLLSLLLASVIRLSFSLDFSKFSLMALIKAIINRLLESLLKFAHTSINFSMSSVMCILDALIQLGENLSEKQDINTGLSISNYGLQINKDTKEEVLKSIEKRDAKLKKLDDSDEKPIFLGQKVYAASFNVPNLKKAAALREGLKKKLPTQEGVEKFQQDISKLKDTINSSIVAVEETILEIFGIAQYLQCESERSVNKISSKLQQLTQYIGLINLIRSIIKKKTRNLAMNIVGNNNTPTYNATHNNLSLTDIADAIGESIDTNVAIAQSADDNIGILILDKPKNSLNQPLDICGCNLNDFIKEANLQHIIADAKTFAENNLVGQGNDPTYVSSEYIKVNAGDNFIPFDIENDDVLEHVKTILSFLNIKNPYEDIVDDRINPVDNSEQYNNIDLKEQVSILRDKAKKNNLDIDSIETLSLKIDNVFGNIGKIKI